MFQTGNFPWQTSPCMTHPTPLSCWWHHMTSLAWCSSAPITFLDPYFVVTPHPTPPLHDPPTPPHPWYIFGHKGAFFHGPLHYVSLSVDKKLWLNSVVWGELGTSISPNYVVRFYPQAKSPTLTFCVRLWMTLCGIMEIHTAMVQLPNLLFLLQFFRFKSKSRKKEQWSCIEWTVSKPTTTLFHFVKNCFKNKFTTIVLHMIVKNLHFLQN